MYYAYYLMEAHAARLNAARRAHDIATPSSEDPRRVPARAHRDWSRFRHALAAMAYAHPFWPWRPRPRR